MSSSSSDQGEPAAQPEGKPEWIDPFLQRTYFGSCEIHGPSKNELDRFCIDCNLPACLHCLNAGSHAGERVLKIYRHTFKDVVLCNELEKNMDCSKIQVKAFMRKTDNSEPPFLALRSPSPATSPSRPPSPDESPISKRARKGVPRRAPLS